MKFFFDHFYQASPSQMITYRTSKRHSFKRVVGLLLNIEQQHLQLPEFKVRCVARHHHQVSEYESKVLDFKTLKSLPYPEMKSNRDSYSSDAHKSGM